MTEVLHVLLVTMGMQHNPPGALNAPHVQEVKQPCSIIQHVQTTAQVGTVFSMFLGPAQVRDNAGPATQEQKVMALIVISVKMVRYRIHKEAQLVQIVRRVRLLLLIERPVTRLVQQEKKRKKSLIYKVSHSALSVPLEQQGMEQALVRPATTATQLQPAKTPVLGV